MNLSQIPYQDKLQLLEQLEALDYAKSGTKAKDWFGPLATRNGYAKHISFLNASADYKIRAFLAANRVGKSETGAYEAAMHATGDYPGWYTGKRFDKPTSGWAVGKTGVTVRDTVQVALLGPPGQWGTGMIPRDCIVHVSKSNEGRADVITVRHKSGGISHIGLKTNDAGRQSFEGTSKDWIWCDEEIDKDVWFECLMRTMTTDGIIYTTFTPLKGLTELVMSLIVDGNLDSPCDGVSITTCSWDDAPHLSSMQKEEMMAALPPHQRAARSRGVPQLGAGVIYPVDPEEYTISPFELPKHYTRFGGMDVGWKKTAALWSAINPEDGTVYIYSEHYKGEAEPVVHAEAIKARGNIPLAIDTAAHGRSQDDGNNLYSMYKELGLNITNANKAVEAGLYEVWTLLSNGRLKIMSNCTNLLSEMKTYRRDDKGKIVKEHDHLCDCLRYLIMGRDGAKQLNPKKIDINSFYNVSQHTRTSI